MTTIETVTAIVVEHLDLDLAKATPDALLQEDLGANSLDVVEFVIQYEDKFDIIIHDKEVKQIKTIRQAAATIDRLVAEKNVPALLKQCEAH